MRSLFAFCAFAITLAGCIVEGGVPATLVRDEEADAEQALDRARIHLGGIDEQLRDASAD